MTARKYPRRSGRVRHLQAVLVTWALALLGVAVLLFAAARPSIGRVLAGGLLLGAAAAVSYQDRHRDDPDRFGRSAQVRSIVWSLVIVVVVIVVSVAFSQPWRD